MQSNLAFIITQLKNDQYSTDILNLVSETIRNRPLDNIAIFCGNCEAIDTGMVPVLHISHAVYFNATIVALDLESLRLSSSFIQKKGLTYYAKSLPWSNKVYSFNELNNLFATKNVDKIISSSSEISGFYHKFFGHNEYVSEQLTYGDINEQL
jgi:hypothetical protein